MNKTIVYCRGTWDLLHTGHIDFIKRAKAFGDILVVGVQTDELAEQEKGNKPFIFLKDRIKCIESLSFVDVVIPYNDFDFIRQCKDVNADIFVSSNTYKGSDKFNEIEKQIKTIYLPYTDGISSTEIKTEINQDIFKENQWKSIWEKVGDDDNLDDLHVNSDNFTDDNIIELVNYILDKLKINPNDIILDYGCGSGLILDLIRKLLCGKHENYERYINEMSKKQFWGIDISWSMIKRAKHKFPPATFAISDNICFEEQFDYIISCGVFQYLPDWDYAKRIIQQMQGRSKKILLVDLPDLHWKCNRENERKKLGKNLFPEHLYFDKMDFITLGFTTMNNPTTAYNYSEFSFNALWEK